VNVVKIDRSSGEAKFCGYNTDVVGFEKSFLENTHQAPPNPPEGGGCAVEENGKNIEKNLWRSPSPPFGGNKGGLGNRAGFSALILGTGGVAKAVAYVLKKLNIAYQFVSRQPKDNALTYEMVDKKAIAGNLLIINATPLGMFPNTDICPPIDYTAIGKEHFLFDLVYNPEETLFLKKGKKHGALVENGYKMLCYQAEEAWKIFFN